MFSQAAFVEVEFSAQILLGTGVYLDFDEVMVTPGRQERGWSEMEAPLLVSLGISG